MKQLSKSFIVVCGIVRNSEKGLKKNIPVINSLCDKAQDYKVVIYENDSKDNTKQILKKWQDDRSSDKIHISLNEGLISGKTIPSSKDLFCNPFFSRKRIEKMVFFRNQYLSYLRTMNWTPDYVFVVDLDVETLFLDSILSSFSSDTEWDAITAYGYSLSPYLRRRYHDAYALVELGEENEPQTEKKIKKRASKYSKICCGDALVRVFSAFGGLAIYRYEAIKNIEYQLIFNNDNRVEVYCEHYSLYFQMKKNGYDRVYINPNMYLKYQAVTLKIIFKTLIRTGESIFMYLKNISQHHFSICSKIKNNNILDGK
ncbi:MAG: glycosyltransferase family 2 protein [Dysgonamonadaceae bacterium]|jgi:hypothetical protein|nr:glycosyltransferase family 2 protein [Dysgonamonadaceae bacterium]